MSKLFSCFLPNKKTRDYSIQESVRRSRGHSRDNNEIVYVDTSAGNEQRFNGNLRQVYRTETNSQTSEYENIFGPGKNRHSRSYPVSPKRRSLYKVYSFEQRPLVEKQTLGNKRDSNNLMLYTANAKVNTPQLNKSPNNSDHFSYEIPVVNLPRRSVLSYGVYYEKEMVSNGRQICKAEKPAEEYHKPNRSEDKSALPTLGKDNNTFNQENEILSTRSMSKENNEEFFQRISNIENQNLLYLAVTEPKIKTVIKTRPHSSKSFRLGGSVKMMTYHAEDVNHSPMSANKYIQQMPIRATKQPPVLTTADGRILMPLSSNTVIKISATSNNENKPVKLSGGSFPLFPRGEAMVAAPMTIGGGKAFGGFPLARGQEVIIAAPIIGGGGRRGKAQKSLLHSRGGNQAPYNTYDYYMGDMYPYGTGNYGQPYYEDYGSSNFMDAPYLYGSKGGYFGGGFPDNDVPCHKCKKGKRSARYVYAVQMPEVTLPDIGVNVEKNSNFKIAEKPLIAPETYIHKDYYHLKNEKPNKDEFSKGSNVEMNSFAQQTDHKNELHSMCFSPGRCFKNER